MDDGSLNFGQQAPLMSGQATALKVQEHRYGNGRAEIREVRIRDAIGFAVTELKQDETYTIEMDVVSHAPKEKVVCGILVRTPFGQELFGADCVQRPDGQFITLNKRERATAKVTFRNNLGAGRYYLTAALANPDQTKLDVRFDVLAFTVVGLASDAKSNLVGLSLNFRTEQL
ncbi:MAG: Wzt carbohydrate-binding domain-containing protein [Hyphomonadaceae bacterium]